jgi:hypothetical protein
VKRLFMVLPAVLAAAGCGAAPRAPFAPCRIQERQCLIDTLLALEGERGQLWDPWTTPPAVSVISIVELDQRLQQLNARNRASDAWGAWDTPLRTLGLLSPTMDILQSDNHWDIDNIAAVYWPQDQQVTIVDRGHPFDDLQAVSTVAHEFTHAAQDREFGLQFTLETRTTDLELVRSTLVEGEASLYGLLAHLRMLGMPPESYDVAGYFHDWLADVRAQTLTADSPHTHARLAFPYPTGGLLMGRAWMQGRSPAVNRILLHAPDSFVSLMLALEGRPGPGPLAPLCPVRVIPSGQFGVLDTDRLGAGLLYAYLARLSGTDDDAWKAALTWRGDQLWSLEDRVSGNQATFWAVHTAGLRDTPLGAQLAASAGVPRLVGDDLLFWSNMDEVSALALHAATHCGR